MRKLHSTLLSSLCAALVLGSSAGAALAQDETDDYPPEGDAPEPVEAVGSAPQVAETHVVASGDTLWDLCSKYLNSPWYWPKIWSYNPQLTNPHWIYPGNELRFYPSDEALPTQVASSMRMADDEDLDVPGELDPDELVTTVGSIQVGRAAPNSVRQLYAGFISKGDHGKAGEIINSQSEADMLTDYDRAYAKLKTAAKKGDRYAVYRIIREIEHPVTGEPYGYAVEILGGIQVVDTSPTVATVQIAQAYRPIVRGDFVSVWPDDFGTRVAPSPNQTETQGYIIETVGDVLGPIGEHDLVFIDRGRDHGVQKGNLFTVLDRGDRYTREVEGLPNEEVGQLMVVDAQEKSATAIVTRSLRELQIGDKIEMRAN